MLEDVVMNSLVILLSIKVILPRSRESNVGTHSLGLDVHLQSIL